MPTDEGGCPDDAACHYNCLVGCWRVANDTPLPSSGRHEWPPSIVDEFTPVEVAPLPQAVSASPSPDPRPSGAQPSPTVPVRSGVQTAGSGEAPPEDEQPLGVLPLLEQLQTSVDASRARRRRPRAADVHATPEQETAEELAELGVPIVDLTHLVRNLHDTRLDLRERARLLRESAHQLEQLYHVVLGVAQSLDEAAGQVEQLRTVLRGGT